MTHAAHNGCEAFEGGGPVAAKIDAGLERADRSVPVRLDEALKYIVARIEMNPRNVDIVTGYLGWDGRGVRTLDELGCTFGLSHEQVKDIVTGAIECMQEARFVARGQRKFTEDTADNSGHLTNGKVLSGRMLLGAA
jgi:hypothetical protein